jgi:hypothetical protein
MEDVCTVLLFDTFYLIGKSCFSFCVNFFSVVESLFDYTKSTILPFIEEITHVSFHESLNLHINSFVFLDSYVVINRCVLDIVKTFIRHTLFKYIDSADQEGTLLTNRYPPALKDLSLSTNKIKCHISSRQRSPRLVNLNLFLLNLL